MKYILSLFLGMVFAVVSHAAEPIHLDPTLGDGVVDATPAFDAAVTAACASPATRTIRIPVGQFRFMSGPAPIPCAINILGEGLAVSHLIRDNDDAEFLVFIGGQDEYGGGTVREIKILTAPGRFGGIAVRVNAFLETDPFNTSLNPHGFMIENVIIGRQIPNEGNWAYGILLDGRANAVPVPGSAEGLRHQRINNVSVAAYTHYGYLFHNAENVQIWMADCFAPANPLAGAIRFINSNPNGHHVVSDSCPVAWQ